MERASLRLYVGLELRAEVWVGDGHWGWWEPRQGREGSKGSLAAKTEKRPSEVRKPDGGLGRK